MATATEVMPPFWGCPKCGDPEALLHVRPRFTFLDLTNVGMYVWNQYASASLSGTAEWLAWTCRNCGYTARTNTADHKKE